ncbi:MAG: hypothetical protein QXS24_05845 [Desulfurococcaceae archaeon]
MTRIRIREGIIEVDGRPYHATELFLQDRVNGVIHVNKYAGIQGELETASSPDISLDYPGVLVIRNQDVKYGDLKVDVLEQRKSLLIKTPRNTREAYEVVVKIDNACISLAASFQPRRITLYSDPEVVKVDEKPFIVYIYVKSRE